MKRATQITKRATLSNQLEKAVETIMKDRDARIPRVDSRIAAILRVAADLRDLPKEDFKARLRDELAAQGPSTGASAIRASAKISPIPEGYLTATTCLIVRDGARAIEFYKSAFGAAELMRHADPSGHIVHAEVRVGDTRIALAEEEGDYNRSPQTLGGSSTVMQLYVDDVDSFAARAVAAGAKVIFPIADLFYGDRTGRLADPFGHLWIVSTHVEEVAPEEMRRRLNAFAQEQAALASGTRAAAALESRPEGFHSITPYLQVEGAGRLIEFLKNAFGAEEIFRVPRGNEIAHALLRIEGSMIEVADAIDKYKPNPTAIWLFVKDADAIYARALTAGATSLHEPNDQDYGDREASVKDPFGNHWYIATHRQDAEPLPEGVHSITPYLHPTGAPKVIDFLKSAFGAEEVFRAQDDAGTVHHAKVRIGDSIIAMGEAHGLYQPMPPALHLYVADTDETYARALAAGAVSIDEPMDQAYGDRYAGVEDPFGNVWYIATHKQTPASQVKLERGEAAPGQSRRSIMPFIYVDDAAGAAELYKKIFGATETERITQPDGKVSHVIIAIGDTNLMVRDATTPDLAHYRAEGFATTPRTLGGTPLHLYAYVADADAAFVRALAEGSKIVDPLEDKDWGDRCGGVQDRFGHIWYIATPLERVPSK
jgi:PhnB protein